MTFATTRDACARVLDRHARITVARSTADLIDCPSWEQDELSLHLLLPQSGALDLTSGSPLTIIPGRLVVVTATAAASVRFREGAVSIVLSFPASIVDIAPSQLIQHTGSPIDTTFGVPAALASLLRSLVDVSASSPQPQIALHLSDAVTALLAATLLGTRLTDGAEEGRGRSSAIFLAVRRWIEDHLGEQGLTITAIADANHISASYLQKLFAAEGTSVTGWVRERRCERCRRDLADPDQRDVAIGQVAERWGFASAAHFSRVFTANYGVTPRDYRTASLRPSTAAPRHPEADP